MRKALFGVFFLLASSYGARVPDDLLTTGLSKGLGLEVKSGVSIDDLDLDMLKADEAETEDLLMAEAEAEEDIVKAEAKDIDIVKAEDIDIVKAEDIDVDIDIIQAEAKDIDIVKAETDETKILLPEYQEASVDDYLIYNETMGHFAKPKECAPGCPYKLINNGHCDKKCFVKECFFDGYDCPKHPKPPTGSIECAPGCKWAQLGNGICNPKCKVAACSYDINDCKPNNPAVYCAPGCPWVAVGNGICNKRCLNKKCYYDHGDCNDFKSY